MNKNKLLHLQYLYKNNNMNELEKNVINDYPLLGPKQCSIKYNLSYNKILWVREKYSLLVNKDNLSKIHIISARAGWKNRIIIHSVDENVFMKNFTKESVYLLGFIWGDGYVSNGGTNKQIRIECVSEDIEALKPVLEKTGKWTYNKRMRLNKKREVTIATTSNKKLINFLVENDYKNKSMATPEKIWNKIPDEFKKYFILGWIDADGCFYHNNKWNLNQFYLSGSYEQDWTVFEKLLNELNIKYKIQRMKNKTKYSCIRTTNRKEIKKIGNYIYDNLIPLKRKHDKYMLIINNLNNTIS